jgi:hypothetical protein
MPTKKTINENKSKFEKISKQIMLMMEKRNIIEVAKLGDTPILINNLASIVIKGRNIILNRNLEAIV